MAKRIWCVQAHVHSFLYHTIGKPLLSIINRLIIILFYQKFIHQRYTNCMRSVSVQNT